MSENVLIRELLDQSREVYPGHISGEYPYMDKTCSLHNTMTISQCSEHNSLFADIPEGNTDPIFFIKPPVAKSLSKLLIDTSVGFSSSNSVSTTKIGSTGLRVGSSINTTSASIDKMKLSPKLEEIEEEEEEPVLIPIQTSGPEFSNYDNRENSPIYNISLHNDNNIIHEQTHSRQTSALNGSINSDYNDSQPLSTLSIDSQDLNSLREFHTLPLYSPLSIYNHPINQENSNNVKSNEHSFPLILVQSNENSNSDQVSKTRARPAIPEYKRNNCSKPSLVIVIDSDERPLAEMLGKKKTLANIQKSSEKEKLLMNKSNKRNRIAQSENTETKTIALEESTPIYKTFCGCISFSQVTSAFQTLFRRFRCIRRRKQNVIKDIQMVKSISMMDDMSTCSSVSVARSSSSDGFLAFKSYGMSKGKYMESRVSQEEFIHMKMKHPNIVQLVGKCDSNHKNSLLFEFIDGDTLQNYIQKNFPLPQSEISRILKEILHALQYIHKKGYTHGDLKSSNILLHKPNNTVKVCDFGASVYIGKRKYIEPTSDNLRMGTPLYSAPETIIADKDGKYKVSKKSDIFQLGLITYELVTGKTPNLSIAKDSQSVFDVIMKLRSYYKEGCTLSLQEENHFDSKLIHFFNSCVMIDLQNRPSAKELLHYPFILEYEKVDLTNHNQLQKDSSTNTIITIDSIEQFEQN